MHLIYALFCGFVAIVSAPISHAANDLIPHHVLNRSELGTMKVALDIEVPLVEGRLPTADELGAVSRFLVSRERKHDRSFVVFYLPGMKIGSGAYATAHHNPDMEVEILDFMLLQYPEYQGLVNN
jgi:hypothetical protein